MVRCVHTAGALQRGGNPTRKTTPTHIPYTSHTQVGRLWTSLADYYIRRGLFERARDVYEEGLSTVVTVHDFSLIFDALTQFEESLLAARMQQMGEADREDAEAGGEDEDEDGESFLLKDDHDDLDLRYAVCSCGCVGVYVAV